MITVKPSTSRFRIERLEERIAPAWWGHHHRGADIDVRVNVNTNIVTNISVSQVAFSTVNIGVANNINIGFAR